MMGFCRKCGKEKTTPRCIACRKANIRARYNKDKESLNAKRRARISTDEEHRNRKNTRNKELRQLDAKAINARIRAKYAADPETEREKKARWRKENPDKYAACRAKGRPKYLETQQDYYWNRGGREKFAKYRKDNARHYSFLSSKRKADLLNAMPPWLSEDQLNQIEQMYLSRPTGYHVDHIVPLRNEDVCGLHVPWNLQHLPELENIKKGNKF